MSNIVKWDEFESRYNLSGTKLIMSPDEFIKFIKFIFTSKRFKLSFMVEGHSYEYLYCVKQYEYKWSKIFEYGYFEAEWLNGGCLDLWGRYKYWHFYSKLKVCNELISMQPGYKFTKDKKYMPLLNIFFTFKSSAKAC